MELETIDTRQIQDKIEELESEVESNEIFIDTEREVIDELEEKRLFIESDLEEGAIDRDEYDAKLSDIEYGIESARMEIASYESEVQGIQTELSELLKLKEEIGSEFEHGETMIHEDYFTEYVRELCMDGGYISRDMPSWIEIDWDATADNVRVDYREVEYDGETYLLFG